MLPPSRPATVVMLFSTVACGPVGCVGDDPVFDRSAPDPSTPAITDAGSEAEAASPAPADPTARYVGSWETSTATQVLSECPVARTQGGIRITLEVTRSSASEIVFTNSLAPTCSLRATVAGDTATLVPGQSCVAAFVDGTDTYSYAPTSTFRIVAPGGSQATMELLATITSAPSGLTCNFRELSPFTRR